MQVGYVLRPQGRRVTLPLLSKHLGFGRVRSHVELIHPELPSDPEDDPGFYRHRKAQLGAMVIDNVNQQDSVLVGARGEGVWTLKDAFGQDYDVSGYDCICGARDTKMFMDHQKLNSITGSKELAFLWPEKVVTASVEADAAHTPLWAKQLDISITIRDLCAIGHRLEKEYATAVAEYEKEHGGVPAAAAEDDVENKPPPPPVSPVNAEGYVQVANVVLALAKDEISVPFYVHRDACEEYGQSYIGNLGVRTPTLPTFLFIMFAGQLLWLVGGDLITITKRNFEPPEAWSFEDLFENATRLESDDQGKKRLVREAKSA